MPKILLTEYHLLIKYPFIQLCGFDTTYVCFRYTKG